MYVWLFLAVFGAAQALCPFHHRPQQTSEASEKLWMSQIPTANDDSDPLVRANNMFHDMYSKAGTNMLPATLVMQENDFLVLLRRDATGNYTRVRSDQIVPEMYHNLKMVSHLPLAVFMMMLPYAKGIAAFPTDAAVDFQLSLNTAAATINSTRFPNAAQLQRQVSICNATIDFLYTALTQHNVTPDSLYSFTSNLSSLININVAEAAQAQIDLMIKVMTQWRQHVLAKDEWEGLRFVSHSSHMASPMNLVSQVFARLLSANPRHPDMGPNDPNTRFITLDDIIMDEQSAQTLLATHYTDYAIGSAFFGSPYRMHRDLLADAAQVYLESLFPPY